MPPQNLWMPGFGSGQDQSARDRKRNVQRAIRDKITRIGRSQSQQIWFNQELKDHEATRNLDALEPATLYYLGLLVDIPEVSSAYVEQIEQGKKKIWAVLRERDFEAMDRIYEIENQTLTRFPNTDLSFRVTVETEEGPSAVKDAVKIFDA